LHSAGTPIGSLPYLESDGQSVATSGAVALYAAREYGNYITST